MPKEPAASRKLHEQASFVFVLFCCGGFLVVVVVCFLGFVFRSVGWFSFLFVFFSNDSK